MQKDRVLKWLRINYAVSVASALLVVLAFESGYLYKGALLNVMSESTVYVVQVMSVMLTVLLIPLAIKSFTRGLAKAKNMGGKAASLSFFNKKALQRIFILFIAIVVSEFVYYGLNYEGALYCAILGYGALAYSYPTRTVLEDYIQGSNK